MTLDEWKSIKSGQTIYSSSSGNPRLVIQGCCDRATKYNCISLKAVKRTWYGQGETVYDQYSRELFNLKKETL